VSWQITVAVVLIVAMNTIGDYFLKISSSEELAFTSAEAHIGAALYWGSAYFWIYVMQRVNLTVVGVLYSSMTILVLTLMSLFIFKEAVTPRQLLAALLALIAVAISATSE